MRVGTQAGRAHVLTTAARKPHHTPALPRLLFGRCRFVAYFLRRAALGRLGGLSCLLNELLAWFTVLRPYLAHFPPVFSRFFARFHRLDEAVPTSPKPEPRAEKQPARGPRGENSALRSIPQVQWKGPPG